MYYIFKNFVGVVLKARSCRKVNETSSLTSWRISAAIPFLTRHLIITVYYKRWGRYTANMWTTKLITVMKWQDNQRPVLLEYNV